MDIHEFPEISKFFYLIISKLRSIDSLGGKVTDVAILEQYKK